MIKTAAASKKGQKASFIAGLRYGSDELDLVCLNDDAFQTKMEELDNLFYRLEGGNPFGASKRIPEHRNH